MNINKELISNTRDYLSAIKGHGWVADFDPENQTVVYEKYQELSRDDYGYVYTQYSYTITGNKASLVGEGVEVVFKKVVEPATVPSDTTMEKLLKALESIVGGSKKESVAFETNVIKQFDEEERIAYEPLYSPPDVSDGAGEGMSEETIVKMVANVNKQIQNGVRLENLGHKVAITKGQWEYLEAFTSPWPECTIGDTVVVKGQPVLKVKYHNERAWELRKEGVIKGPSIGAHGKRVESTDE